MNKKFLTAAFLLAIAISCKKSNETYPTDPVQLNLSLKQATIASSADTFAFELFNRIGNSKGTGNVIFSPLSISYALSMTANGAAGLTRDSILKALGLSELGIDDLDKSYKDLTSALLGVDSRVKMEIANSVWENKDYPAKQAFKDILAAYFNAESSAVDFSDPSTVNLVNNWISGHTNGLIRNMIDQLNSDDIMLLINAIYFKGKWKVQFDASNTTTRSFTLPGSSTIDVPTMSVENNFKVYMGENEGVIELPYGQGNFVMDIVLPASNNPNSLTAARFSSLLSLMHGQKVKLYLPKFKYAFKEDVSDILKNLGMGIAFSDSADFSNIMDQLQLQISRVLHQAFIETNEEGTEAAAATVVEIIATSIGPTEPLVFNIDHQFTYVIREVTTNTILFMGRVTDPSVQ
ncbi:MAG TPA: serpin family protein [Bacteroidales bacterium]|nr:serpin family protein [Bacteroidales bacterium]